MNWFERKRMLSLVKQASQYRALSKSEGQDLGQLIQKAVNAGVLERTGKIDD